MSVLWFYPVLQWDLHLLGQFLEADLDLLGDLPADASVQLLPLRAFLILQEFCVAGVHLAADSPQAPVGDLLAVGLFQTRQQVEAGVFVLVVLFFAGSIILNTFFSFLLKPHFGISSFGRVLESAIRRTNSGMLASMTF